MPVTRPAKITLGEVTASVVRARGPRAPQDGRWYWRARRGAELLGVGWRTPAEVPLWVAELLVGQGRRQVAGAAPTTVGDLVDAYSYTRAQDAKSGQIRGATEIVIRGAARRVCGVPGRVPRSPIADVRLDRLDRSAVDSWVRWSLARRASSTTELDLRVVMSAWAWGRAYGYTPDRAMPHPRITVQRVRPDHHPSAEEVQAVLQHLPSTWMQDAVVLLWETGMRIGELAGVRVGDWDRRGRRLTVTGKTGTRTFPVTPPAAAVLDRLTADALPGAFALRVGSLRTELGKHVRTVARTLGQPPWVIHALRASWVDAYLDGGGDPSLLLQLLGHSPEVALRHYRKARPAALDAAVQTLSAQRAGTGRKGSASDA